MQSKLLELDGGAFQKLADAYMHKKGYEGINPVGSVTGADKVRKGTPDSYAVTASGNFVFFEYTTQREGLYQKLFEDLVKCLDESKTGVPIDKIEEIVFCHVGTLSPEEEDSLRQQCQSKKKKSLKIFGIGPISHDLLEKYPQIARDFLGIELDTGQIVEIDDFVTLYDRSATATPLDTTFHFREADLAAVVRAIETENTVVITGHPGVGKSRLALEGCREFVQKHPEYTCRCILYKGYPELYEDLRLHFSQEGHYLIFVDDANRLQRLEYVLHLLSEQTERKTFKILITARDYAVKKVRDVIAPFGQHEEITITAFNDDQIQQFVKEEFGILNHLYLERIADIAKGNPRLAVMAAQVARKKNTLLSINDVSALYDQYYDSIRRDLQELEAPHLLETAALIAFFRTINFEDEELVATITQVFEIPLESLFHAARTLHDLELVDLYENKIVKFSDQVLATYILYLAFFKLKVASLSSLLEYFFPRFRSRIIDAINPILSAFDFDSIKEALRLPIERRWEALSSAEDEGGLFALIVVFWFVKETDSLLYIHEKISHMEAKPQETAVRTMEPVSGIPEDSVLSILKLFQSASEINFVRIALEYIFEYAQKRPEDLGKVLHVLSASFGFTHHSYLRNYIVQQLVIDTLWDKSREGQQVILGSLFVAVSECFLHTRFQTDGPTGGNQITWINFELGESEPLRRLRKSMWVRIFSLYRQPRVSGTGNEIR